MPAMTVEAHRVLLGVLLFLNGGISVANTWSHNSMSYSHGVGLPKIVAAFTGRFFLPGLVYGCAILAWVLEVEPLWAGLTAILVLMWFRRMEEREWPGKTVVSLGSYAPAALCLLGVICGQALWHLGFLDNASGGWDIAAGIIGGGWTLSGVNKLRDSGLAWMGARNMALFVAERSVIGNPYARRLRGWMMNSPNLLVLVGWFGLIGELAGLLFCFPQCRPMFAGFVCVFLIANWVFFGFMEHEWGLVMVAIAIAG